MKTKNNIIYTGSLEKSPLHSVLNNHPKVVILVDENTRQLINDLPLPLSLLEKAIIIQIKSGEENKNLSTSIDVWNVLSENNIKRNDFLINLGGGVITDMGGFIASTYKRGMNFINIPTSLLAMVDASIGGKTGIDFHNFKNFIGTFSNPAAVFCDEHFLSTLPNKELISGFAEVLKHGLIKDENYWDLCTNISFSELKWDEIIAGSIKIKKDIVTRDPNEYGERKLLNFGHTIGHAIETYMMNQKTPVLHGEAVAAGMICESFISLRLEQLPKHELSEISNRITNIFPKINIEKTSYNSLFELMKNDKKNNSNDINFTLLSGIGKGVFDKTASKDLIFESLDYYMKLIK